ncbi:uncharacterized protein SPAPADRAFT_62461 [Spathaspora passalidarum NRRL Y-27907]|uniref:Uncharacterized protein n=1 Tax=Spathaspora passalidarum (strain NRRL Y-27907 / 11-Y1) TaxID=619300 RepID=G3AS02_SPAPN|nr:uncharacterized protein SPAPADRAFT_62461 [Spathaspora passalidarum NRRL Y-27907]EGW31851.1 hypothetical protein SPAPADRAFT_62461 [Spathaspora passalidarum NRRL Y-27907]
MLRSQSINSLGEHKRNKSSSFFSAFRTKKSQSQLQPANDNSSLLSNVSRRSRRSLSTTISAFNLSEMVHEDYDEDKENVYEYSNVNEKPLRPRSSAPMLNKSTPSSATTSTTNSLAASKFYSTSRRSIRSSMFMLARVGSRQVLPSQQEHPEIHIHHDQVNISTPESTLTETAPNSIDINVDSIFDQSSITCGDSENDDYSLSSSSTRHPSPNNSPDKRVVSHAHSSSIELQPARLHRTINSYNINDFMQGMNEDDDVIITRLPISNRKSIELENKQIEQLNQKLNQETPDNWKLNISLVGNIVFVTGNAKSESELSYFMKDLDDINYLDALTNEDYISQINVNDD